MTLICRGDNVWQHGLDNLIIWTWELSKVDLESDKLVHMEFLAVGKVDLGKESQMLTWQN
jgi:hypothetical protein